MKTGILVSDAMTINPVVVSPDLTIKECANLMKKNNVGSLIVKEDHTLLGIITEEDLVYEVIAKNLDVEKIRVKTVMVKEVITIDPSQDIYDALVKMNKSNIRQLPVTKGNRLLGLLTLKDILKIEPQLFELISAKYQIRESERKPLRDKYVEGECENCGNYSQLYEIEGTLICEECKDKV